LNEPMELANGLLATVDFIFKVVALHCNHKQLNSALYCNHGHKWNQSRKCNRL